MVAVASFVLETSNAPGTGTFNLAGTSTGRRTWTGTGGAFASGTQVYYAATDGNQWEEGAGTVTSGSPNTLSRDTVIENSLGTTARINFTGSTQVYCGGPTGKRTPFFTADNTALDFGSRKGANLTQGVAGTDAVRLDQVGSVRTSTIYISSGVLVIPLPALLIGDNYHDYEIDLSYLTCSGNTGYFLRISLDGGSTYLSGTSEYSYDVTGISTGTVSGAYGASGYAPLTTTVSAGAATRGKITYDPRSRQWEANLKGITAGGSQVHFLAAGNSATSGTPTHISFGAVGQNLSTGQARISQRGY